MEAVHSYNTVEGFATKIKAYIALLKCRLSFLVAFSGAIGYMLASSNSLDWNRFLLFVAGGFLATGSANIINQIIEKDYDKLMKRTMNRPLPTGVLNNSEALFFSLFTGALGLFLLFNFVNVFAALLTLLSMVLYAFVYTPLKRKGPIAVFVGAFPGALPPLIGWVAMQGTITHEAVIIFLIQFIWQFPHFWAIAWVADEDYKRAGFKLLPSTGGKDLNTAFTIMIYTLLLIPLGLLPTFTGITGLNSGIIATVMGVLFLMQTFYLMKACSRKAALQMMFGSFIYLPVVQIAYVVDKI